MGVSSPMLQIGSLPVVAIALTTTRNCSASRPTSRRWRWSRRAGAASGPARIARHAVAVARLATGPERDRLGLRRRVLEHAPRGRVDHQHVRPGRGVRGRTMPRAGRSIVPASDAGDHEAVGMELIRHRPQPVAVEPGADADAVREHEAGRPVPWLDARRSRPATPRGRRRGSVRSRAPRASAPSVPSRSAIRTRRRSSTASSSEVESEPADRASAHRPGPARPAAARATPPAEIRGPTLHRRAVAADRVDLAVVGEEPERLRQPPRGGVRL